MNIIKSTLLLSLVIFSSSLFAYGSSSSKKACKKPGLSQFSPEHLSVVKPESEFSFKASHTTNPKSIAVSIKKQAVPVNIEQTAGIYVVTGKLPASLQDTYARINIKAKGTNNCPGSDGWLLKIEP